MSQKTNMNTLAKKLCELEKGKTEVSIAQAKELIKCLADLVSTEAEYRAVFFRYLDYRRKKLGVEIV